MAKPKPLVKNPIQAMKAREGREFRKKQEKKQKLKDRKEKQIAMDKAKGTYQEPGLLQKLAGKFVRN